MIIRMNLESCNPDYHVILQQAVAGSTHEPIIALENVAQKPLVLLVKLNVS